MKSIVVYKSNTGFTKKYAEWIAEALKCKAISLEKISEYDVVQADTVIFGGWIMGNMINGLDKIQKFKPYNLVVYATGAAPALKEVETEIISQNKLEGTPFFYYQGGVAYDRLSLPARLVVKGVCIMAAKKSERSAKEEFFAKVKGQSFDETHRENIQSLIDSISN